MELLLEENPRRRYHRRRRNPSALALPTSLKGWTMGLGVMDVAAAVGGLAAATMIPNMLIRTPVTTTTSKVLKVALAFGSAIGVAMLIRSVVGSKAGQMAAVGGIAGATAQTLATFTTFKIAGNPSPRLISTGGIRIANDVPSFGVEQPQIITP